MTAEEKIKKLREYLRKEIPLNAERMSTALQINDMAQFDYFNTINETLSEIAVITEEEE